MIVEDVVECRGCGSEITHIQCSGFTPPHDEDYYLCDACTDETHSDEESD